MSKLLINEPPLQVLPSLATAIGLQEAIVLQQVHYWLGSSRNEQEGRKWVYNTYEQWSAQFPFWTSEAIRKIFKSLRTKGLIVVMQAAPSAWNKTNFYSIDYDALDLVTRPENLPDDAVNLSGRCGKNVRIDAAEFTASQAENSSETPTEIIPATPTGSLAIVVVETPEPAENPAPPKPPSAYQLQLAQTRSDREVAKSQKAQESARDKDAQKLAQADLRRDTWAAFDAAYQSRYSTTLTRNATTNSQMAAFVGRLGAEAPEVAAFYLRVNDAFVVRNTHGLGLLLNGAEAYRTQWATGQTMTTTRAKQIDQSQANFSVVGEAMAIRRAKQEAQHAQ